MNPAVLKLSELSHEQKDALIVDLCGQIQVLSHQVEQLQGRLKLNSRNSSKPPSTDGLSKPAPKSLRVSGQNPIGGPKGHKGHTLSQSEEVEQTITHAPPSHCQHCQRELGAGEVVETRQVFELPRLSIRTVEHRQMRSVCTCGAVHVGRWPEGVSAPAQYGAGIKAMAVHLNQHHLVPLQRTTQLMQDLWGVSLSQASVQRFAQEAAQTLQPTVQAIGNAVRSAPIVHADETGIRVQGRLQWLHCAVTQSLSWLAPHKKRGLQAIEALGLLLGVGGVLVHDGLISYKALECTHALCNAHHLRELQYVHEQENEKIWDSWAQEMATLLVQALHEVQQQGAGALAPQRQAWYQSQWEDLLCRGEAQNPVRQRSDTSQRGQRGRIKQSKATNLLARLREFRDDVWRFTSQPGVPFTNNLAEQALRMAKVKQKISGCFRTEHGAQTFFTIRSYLATMAKQGVNLFDCLLSTFERQPIQPCFDG